MRYSIALAILLSSVLVSSVPQYSRCPLNCKCDSPVIKCDNLDMEKFGSKVFTLKVVNPREPLTLGENVFKKMGLADINTIFIENARIREIHPRAFSGLEKLQSLSLENCEIMQFSPETIQFPASIERLSFSGTPIKHFDNTKLGSLSELIISNCNLSAVTKNMFAEVPKLTYINLSHNNIDAIDDSAFSTLKNLEEVSLSNNKISKLTQGTFGNNLDLLSVDLSYNPLNIVDVTFNSDIEKLVLKACNLTEFGGLNLELLSYLDISDNLIDTIGKTTFEGMPQLEYLDMSSNKFTTLDSDIFKKNSNLQKIVLNNNKLERLPKFYSLDTFATNDFSCNDCDLTLLDEDTFENFPAIVILRLSGNDIDTITTTFQHLHALTLLDISENEIGEIDPQAFKNNSALRTLNLSGNALSEIDSALFSKNKVLKELDISGCGLTTIWKQPASNHLESVLILNVASNIIKYITVEDLKVTPNIQILNITDNSIACNSQFKDAALWLENNEVSPSKTPRSMPLTKKHSPEAMTSAKTWSCPNIISENYDYNYDNSNFDIYEDYDASKSTTQVEDLAFVEDPEEISLMGTDRYVRVDKYAFFWPTLVFLLTALLVLVVAANVILLVLRKKGNLSPTRTISMPHVKILPWLGASKMKKHSGTVYRPLSEENIDSRSSFVIRSDVPNNVAVHAP